MWWDARDGNEEIYTKQSADWGNTWGPDVRLTNDPAPSTFVTVAAAESGVHIVWQDQREGNLEILYARAPGTLTKASNGLIAFSKRDASGQPQIHTIQPDADKSDLSANEHQLTNLRTNMFPAWSEDGARMAFATNRTGTFEIWMMDSDGSNQTQITFNAINPPGGMGGRRG